RFAARSPHLPLERPSKAGSGPCHPQIPRLARACRRVVPSLDQRKNDNGFHHHSGGRMRVAFVGKGGSGKTTLSSLFPRYAAAHGPAVAIDADINQHLGLVLGAPETPPPLGGMLTEIKEYLRGDNPRIKDAASMVKTTPPGRGSRLITIDDPFFPSCRVDGVRLTVTGPFAEDDLGVACYHSKVGAVELYLNHLIDGPGEYVVVDMTAGADCFASGLFTRFDLIYLVAEPTLQGVG